MLAAHGNNSWSAKVIHCIVACGHFQVSREFIAEKLNVSTRTLQRRLQEENTNFIDILDQQKMKKAEELIIQTDKSLKAIAIELGFAESSTFYRACHRWFGITPNTMRLNNNR